MWSERVEELVDEGDRQGAIKLLQDVVDRMQGEDGAESNLSLAAAMGDLAAFYEQDGLAFKADSLRNSSIVIKLRAQRLSEGSSGAPVPEENPSTLEEEDWEKNDYEIITPGVSKPVKDDSESIKPGVKKNLKKNDEKKSEPAQQRGRGVFTYGSSGMYSDRFRGDDADGIQEEESSNYALYGAGHVLVISGIPPGTSTKQLEQLVAPYESQGAVIRWVNDTIALAVFKNPTLAREALRSIRTPRYRVKAYDDAAEFHEIINDKDLEPPAARPATSAVAAQRMISGALARQGMMSRAKNTSRVEGVASSEAQKLKDERKQRLLTREKLREEAWGD